MINEMNRRKLDCNAITGSAPVIAQPIAQQNQQITSAVVWAQWEEVWTKTGSKCSDAGNKASGDKCVINMMKAGGASKEAIGFAETLISKHETGWADSFEEFGRVDLLTTFYPFRANTNGAYFLVNGTPNIIEVDSYELTASDQARPDLKGILRRNPNVFLISKTWFERREDTQGNGSRFVFVDLFATCRACEPVATAEIAYSFDGEGVFQGSKLLGVKKGWRPR